MFVARVTADVDALQQFMEWGGIAWICRSRRSSGRSSLMLVFSWQLTVAIVGARDPAAPDRVVAPGPALGGFDAARTRVGEMLSEVSESVMGAAVVRAYGLDEQTFGRGQAARSTSATGRRWWRTSARPRSSRCPRSSTRWPSRSVVVLGAGFGPEWGLTFGRVTAFLFLADAFLHVFTDLPEIYSETQTAIAGWRKILAVLDLPVEIVEPVPGVELPGGRPLGRTPRTSEYALPGGRPGPARDLARHRRRARTSRSSARPAAARPRSRSCSRGSPTRKAGRIQVGGVDLREIAAVVAPPIPPHGAAGRVPVRHDRPRERPRRPRGRHRPRRRDGVRGAGARRLGGGAPARARHAGRRAGRGPVRGRAPARRARARADRRSRPADPGRGHAAVDPATERRISEALRRLSEGRTTITVAHRLSTAEGADRVFVFDAGRLVRDGDARGARRRGRRRTRGCTRAGSATSGRAVA